MPNWFWFIMVAIVLLAIAFAIVRSRRRKPRPGLYDRALPRDGEPAHHTKTIPLRATTVPPGKHFPMDEVRRADDGEGDFATSAMVSAATGSPILGAMVGGSIAGAAVGSLLTIDYENEGPKGDTPSTDDSWTSSDSGGDSGGGD